MLQASKTYTYVITSSSLRIVSRLSNALIRCDMTVMVPLRFMAFVGIITLIVRAPLVRSNYNFFYIKFKSKLIALFIIGKVKFIIENLEGVGGFA